MLETLANDFLSVAITQLAYSTILFCIAWTAASVLGHRLPHLRLILWLVVLLRLLVPTDLFTPWSIGAIVSELRSGYPIEIPVIPPDLSSASASEEGTPAEGSAAIWPLWLAIVWIGGFTVSFHKWRRWRGRQLESLRAGEEAPTTDLLELVEDWRIRLEIDRRVRIRVSTGIPTPFTFGILRPTVCLPSELTRHLELREISIVIGHELAHVRRFDDLWLRLEALVRCLYFFHPVVWVATARLSEIREQLTDELTLRGGAIESRHYAKMLLTTVSLRREPCVAPAFGAHPARVLERRIRSLLEHSGSRRRAIAVSAGIAAGIFLLPMSLPASSERAPVFAGERIALDHPLPASRISSPFGPRRDPFSSSSDRHQGIDLAAPSGTPVLAPAAGRVVEATEMFEASPSQGSVVILQHAEGVATFYSHLDRILVDAGETVTRGQTIGLVGSTGRVTGPHLHFELWTADGPVDPSKMIPELRPLLENP